VQELTSLLDPATISSALIAFEQDAARPEYWLAVLKIIWIDILLSGDNALVIALACRSLPQRQRKWGMILGAGAAVTMRILFATVIVTLMTIPYLKLIGGLALLVIAAKLIVPDRESDGEVGAASSLVQAVRLIVVADIVMSLDNVIAIAAAADGRISLLIFGLLVSIPLIIAGATLIIAVLDRLPVLVWAGAALLGWIAGHVIATDIAVAPLLHHLLDGKLSLNLDFSSVLFGFNGHTDSATNISELLMSVLGIIVVLIVGALWRKRRLEADNDVIMSEAAASD
jgi:YjbE family integral membrane protein